MKRTLLALLLLAASACSLFPGEPADPSVVRVETGELRGVAAGGVLAFKGVPFAAPPVGAMRWRPPQRAGKWDGVREARNYGNVCMQKYPSTDNGIGRQPASEDCLTLNVWTQDTASRRPVMVWIHGGGFVNGSGTAELYDGTQLAKRGLVIVTINYRMGRFGSFAHPLLTREAAGQPTANWGMMDMIASLEWVKRNIAAFGGDAGNVTIFGESAGGIAVNRLMISPKARGLFNKAIVESGAGREVPLDLTRANAVGRPSAEAVGEAFIKSLGMNVAGPSDLRLIPADKIMAAGDPPVDEAGPVVDGILLTKSVADAFAAGEEAKVPYLVGSNSVEWPATAATVQATLSRMTQITQTQQDTLAKVYPDADTFAANIVGDLVFTEPARHLAALHARNRQPTYLYRFSVLSTSVRGRMKGTQHAQERQYVFDTLSTAPYPSDDNDKVQAKVVGDYWAAFARTGDPNSGGGRPQWPKYSAAEDKLIEFTNDGPVSKTAPYPERWKALAAR